MSRSRAAWLVVTIIALGAALRLYHAQAVGGRYASSVEQEEGYYEAGITMLSCHALGQVPDTAPSAFRAPIYPSFLALCESFFALPSPYHPRLAQTLLSTLAVATAALLGWLLFSPTAGIFAGALLAFNLEDILSVSSLNIHSFYGMGLLALGLSLVLWLEKRDAWRTGLLSLMLATTFLARPAHFPFPLLLAAACLWRWKFPEGRWRPLLSVAAGTALFLAPMGMRNGLQFGNFSPFDLKGAYILVRSTVGPFVNTTVEEALDAAESIEPGFKARALDGRPLHEALVQLSVRRIMSDPWAYAGYCVERLFLFWRGLWFYLALGAYALWRRRGDRPLEALILTTASLSGYALAGGTQEYRASAIPLLCVISGAGLASLPVVRPVAAGSAATVRLLRAGILILPAVFVGVYAAMIVFLGLELRDNFRTASVPSQRDPCPDGRARHVLRIGALQAGGKGPAEDLYAKMSRKSGALPPAPVLIDLAQLGLERAERAFEAGARETALKSMARAEKSNPSDSQLRRMVELYREMNEFSRAAALLKPMLKRLPLDAGLRLERAELAARAGKRAAALEFLAQAESSRPDDDARRRIVGLYRELKDYRSASTLLATLLKSRPDAAILWLERAEIEMRTGARGAARESLLRAESLPSDPAERRGETRHRIALAYQSLGEHDRAIALLEKLGRQYPAEGVFYGDLGISVYFKGERDAAIGHLETAIRLKPNLIPAYLTLGAIYTASGRHADALKLYDEGLARNPAGTGYPLRDVLHGERGKILPKAGMLH